MFAASGLRPTMSASHHCGAASLASKTYSAHAARPLTATRASSISTIQPKAPSLDILTPSVEFYVGGNGPSGVKLAGIGPDEKHHGVIWSSVASEMNANGFSAPVCDWQLSYAKKDPTIKKLLTNGIVPNNAISVAESVAKYVERTAATVPAGTTSPVAKDINFLFLAERLIELALAGFVCSRSLVPLFTAVSFFKFGPDASDILIGQHAALAAHIAGAMGYATCKDKSSLPMEGMVKVIEAHVRAPTELSLPALPTGIAVPNRQRDLLHLFGGEISPGQAARVFRAWGTSRARFGVAPCPIQRRYIQETVNVNASELSWSDLESLPNTVAQFDWHMHSYDAMKTLRAVSAEAVARAAAAPPRRSGILPNAAAVLVESQRVANNLPLQGCGSALSNDVEAWLRDFRSS